MRGICLGVAWGLAEGAGAWDAGFGVARGMVACDGAAARGVGVAVFRSGAVPSAGV